MTIDLVLSDIAQVQRDFPGPSPPETLHNTIAIQRQLGNIVTRQSNSHTPVVTSWINSSVERNFEILILRVYLLQTIAITDNLWNRGYMSK